MNAPVPSRVFKNGNSIAVRLPKGFGFAAGQDVLVEQRGAGVFVVPKVDVEHERRRLADFMKRMRALPSPGEIEVRDTEELPERPRL